jgi:thiol-disulfide isomerase/thioredoxin
MRRINKSNFITAFSITTLIFIAGFATSSVLYDNKVSHVQQTYNQLYLDSMEIEAQYDLAYSDVCDTELLVTLSRNLNDMGDKLDYLDRTLTDESLQDLVRNTKRQYFMLEVKHSIFVEQVNAECGYEYPIVFYFYSNRDCPACELQGVILTEYKQDYPNTMVYSFDIASDSAIVDTLVKKYDVVKTPTIVHEDTAFDYTLPRSELDAVIEQSVN